MDVGTLRLIPVLTNQSEVVAYGQDIVLRQGEEKSYQVEIPVHDSGAISALLQITDSHGVIVHKEKVDFPYYSGGDFYVMGILSDDYSALNYFDGREVVVNQYPFKVRIVELDEENMPENGEILKICQMILINDYDTARLSDRQYQALKEWVNNGGVLLIGTGAGYQNVFNKFDDGFISGTTGSLAKTSLTIGEEAVAGVDVLDYQFAEAVPLLDAGTGTGGKSLEHVRPVGLGKVVVLGYNPGMEPLYSWSGRTELAQMLINESLSQMTDWTAGTTMSYGGYEGDVLPGLMDSPRRPSSVLYGLLFLVYAVAVGPILYLILNKNKKRERLWIMICMVALVFTGLVYLTSLYYRVRNPIINNFAIIRLSDSMKAEEVKSELIIPESKAFQLRFDAAYHSFSPYWDPYAYGINELTEEYQYTVKGGESIVLDIEKQPAFSKIKYSVERYAANDIGTLDIDIRFYPTGEFSGTVTNNTNADLEEVTVSFQNNVYVAGNMEKGETHQIVESEIDYSNSVYLFTGRYDIYSTSRRSDAEIKKDVLLSEMQSYMWENYTYENSNLCSVWGLMKDYDIRISDDSKVKQNSGALVIQQYTAAYLDMPGNYIADISDLNLGSGEADRYYDGIPEYLSSNYATFTYDFGETAVDTLWVDRKDSYYEYADVFAFNNETNSYEQIFIYEDVVDLDEKAEYLADGRLILQYVYPDLNEYAYIPRISAWQEGK